jgi:hypothetical protein
MDPHLISPESMPGFWTPFGVFITILIGLLLLFAGAGVTLYVLFRIEGSPWSF